MLVAYTVLELIMPLVPILAHRTNWTAGRLRACGPSEESGGVMALAFEERGIGLSSWKNTANYGAPSRREAWQCPIFWRSWRTRAGTRRAGRASTPAWYVRSGAWPRQNRRCGTTRREARARRMQSVLPPRILVLRTTGAGLGEVAIGTGAKRSTSGKQGALRRRGGGGGCATAGGREAFQRRRR